MSYVSTIWTIFSFALGGWWIAYGIQQGVEHGEWHPWYIVVLLGFVFVCWGITEFINRRIINTYKTIVETHKETIEILLEENMAMHKRLRQWN